MSPGTLISKDEFQDRRMNEYNIYGLSRGKLNNKNTQSGQINVRRNLE